MLNPDPIYTSGETILLSGTTIYNTDNRILINVFPASFGPKSKYEPAMTGGASVIVPVLKGSDGVYFWECNLASAGWVPDMYMVTLEVVGKGYRESAVFTLTEHMEKAVTLVSKEKEPESVTTSNKTEVPKLQTQVTLTPITEKVPLTPEPTQKSPIIPLIIISALVIAGKIRMG